MSVRVSLLHPHQSAPIFACNRIIRLKLRSSMTQRALALRPPPPKTIAMIISKLSRHLKQPHMKTCKKLEELHPHQQLQDGNNIIAQMFGVKNHPECELFRFISKMRKCNRRVKNERNRKEVSEEFALS